MARYDGSNGDNTLAGTGADDEFFPLLGNDTVNGGGGFDTLTADYSGTAAVGVAQSIRYDPTDQHLFGILRSSNSSVSFSDVEALVYKASNGHDELIVDAAGLAFGRTLNLDGGEGSDLLSIDFSSLTDTSFNVATGGGITSNRGTYANFETFNVTLGRGVNSVTTSSGDDVVRSTSGADTIDGGQGLDAWSGNFAASTAALTFDGATGQLSNGTSLTGIEQYDLTTGSGGDRLLLSGAAVASPGLFSAFNAGAGQDSLTLDLTARAGSHNVRVAGAGVSLLDQFLLSDFDVLNVENVAVKGGTQADYFTVVASTFPAVGTLSLDGGAGADIVEIDFSNLTSTTFTVGSAGAVTSNQGSFLNFERYRLTVGAGTNNLTGGDNNDSLAATQGGTNVLDGGAGNDVISTTGGSATVTGGDGNDQMSFTGSFGTGDGGAGQDSWKGTYSGNTAITFSDTFANSSADVAIAQVENYELATGSGNDTFLLSGAATQVSINAGAGTDRLVYDLSGRLIAASIGIIGTNGSLRVDGPGGSIRDVEQVTITGTTKADTINVDAAALANATSLTLDGQAGLDTLNLDFSQVAGPATFRDNGDGTVTSSRGTFSNFEIYNLVGGADGDALTGGGGADLLNGGAGDDVLNGGAGLDTASYAGASGGVIVGLAITSPQDTFSAGFDTLTSIENLTGSSFADRLTGNGNNNTLRGALGNDLLDGGSGADTMFGGSGNDVYVVEATGDVVREDGTSGFDDGGTDTVRASISYTLGAFVEYLILTGTDNINGKGNGLVNTITGNAASNVLDGGGGRDRLAGGLGDDTYVVNNAGIAVVEGAGAGSDTVQTSINYTLPTNVETLVMVGSKGLNVAGNAAANAITGTSSNDVIDGKAGADTMTGEAGNDTYYVDNAADSVIELTNGGTDTLYASLSYTLADNVERLILSGASNLRGTGNALINTVIGNDAANQIAGLGGRDTLTGGLGADLFVYQQLSESTVATGGRDTITDFSLADRDRIDLRAIDANTSVGGDQAFRFVGASAFSGSAGELRYAPSGGDTLISGDVNGDKVADFAILLSGTIAPMSGNFLL